ncbi:MAG: FAD-dependent oxidoreductase [Bacillota bacterium]|jgi:hypothetical protein
MLRVVIIGGGWAGCAAALEAKKTGPADEIILLERCDMLLGTGLVGGIMSNNGRFTASEELIAMGSGELFQVTNKVLRHKNIDFPGHRHASLYDVVKIEPAVKHRLSSDGIKIYLNTRVVDVKKDSQGLLSVITVDGREFSGDVFIDTSGTAGPPGNCAKYGNGCVMCIYRCPTFGPRTSIAARAGLEEKVGLNDDGLIGSMSGSCKLSKDSLDKSIVQELNNKGVVVIPIPRELRKKDDLLRIKACQQYTEKEFEENIVLLDTGHAKLMSPYYPLELLRQVSGLENARFEDPYSGGVGNSMRFLAISPCNVFLQTKGIENLFCAGEKAGPLVGHTEAIITGTLAGYNAVRWARQRALLSLPETLACGDMIAQVCQAVETDKGLAQRYSFSGGIYFKRMQDKGLYTTDIERIKKSVEKAGMTGIFNHFNN